MITNGYSLIQMEIVNWGNFHGYQKFNLRRSGEGEGLFAAPQASAILGVNGSGKTTLIDALMITLLPFENSVKLGVTNDYESGAGGGRTIKDYVLGKFSSSQDGQADPKSVYNREKGCSTLLLRFQHNSDSKRYLTLGRLWWYSNYKVSDTQLGLLCFDSLTMADLCPEERIPKSAKAFKANMKASSSGIQIYETMQSYFTALSGALGGVSRNDLKLLNRAFYVKSISHIDPFIKENMLLSAENPYLDRLLENVRNGQEIASAIETCERKLHSINRIIKELEKLSRLGVLIKELKQERSLFELLPDFKEIEQFKVDLETHKITIEKARSQQPDFIRQMENNGLELASVQAQIDKNDAANKISLMQKQVQHLSDKITWGKGLVDKWTRKLAPHKIFIPKSTDEIEAFQIKLEKLRDSLNLQIVQGAHDLDQQRIQVYETDQQSQALKQEIEHLTRSGSLIPQRIYEIKEQAVKDLKIPAKEIRFLAELVQIKPEFEKYRKPVEAVFFAVAKNILCHPAHLDTLTRWLDKNGFRADITVKRISEQELLPFKEDLEFDQTSILNFIEVLSEEEHPFTHYIWRWCEEAFDFKLVEASQFNAKGNRRLVTREGLLKNDTRTMRKLKKDFPFSLGWDTRSTIERKSQELMGLGKAYQKQREDLVTIETKQNQLQTELSYIEELLSSKEDILLLCSHSELEKEKKQLHINLEELRDKAPELKTLHKKLEALEQTDQRLRKKMAEVEYRIEDAAKKIGDIEKYLPLREERFFNSKPFLKAVEFKGSTDQLLAELRTRQEKLTSKGVSPSEASADIDEDLRLHEQKKNASTPRAIGLLAEHQRTFGDTSVAYKLEVEEMKTLIEGWEMLQKQLENTELPKAREKWQRFFDQILIDSVKDTLNEIKARISDISDSIKSINEVLKLTNFEELPTEERYLQIEARVSSEDRIRKFRRNMQELESVLGPSVRMQEQGQSETVMNVLIPFVEEFQKEPSYRDYVTDVRNHFRFQVHSLMRLNPGEDPIMETFTGARKDAKSSAQTTQLAYALLASSLAYRFRFHDPVGGQETPRLIILDEFGGKFDNEKPREIVKLINQMGFQSILLSPMSKADLLAESIGQMIFVHKLSAQKSKVKSFEINSLEDYHKLLSSQSQQESAAAPAQVTS